MDEINMNIESEFATTHMSKIAEWGLKKSLGYDIDILLKQLKVTSTDDGGIHAHLDVDAEISKEELKKIPQKLLKKWLS
ncbi:MAG: CTP synthase [Lachnoclostridium sp.]|nr:CTP synthase [Lachnospira sp.]MCM1248842.1 CTP synthase [Lachnoclostridium sp.]MCM1535305.1 CTP synthase [Clostridium sp.]